MTRRYLFGPVSAEFASCHLHRQRRAGQCQAFDPAGHTDLRVGLGDSWEDVAARLPAGWQPDFVVLNLGPQTIPAALWSAPMPVVGVARNARLLWHYYAHVLPSCDLVLAQPTAAEFFTRAGLKQARIVPLCDFPLLPAAPSDSSAVRDIDILFAGGVDSNADREKLPWLGRLARLGERWRVSIRANVADEERRQLLGRARIVFDFDPWC